MTPLLIRILFFFLIPAGIFLLVRSIRFLRRTMGGDILLNIPFTQSDAQFTLPKEGKYAIWQKGRKIRKAAAAMPMPVIHNEQSGTHIRLEYPFATISTNDGRYGKVRVFLFQAPAGQYHYNLFPDTSAKDTFPPALRTHIVTDTTDCSIEIKESQPAWLLVAGILLLIFSGFCIITGLVVTLSSFGKQ